jgi:hypothetical protein
VEIVEQDIFAKPPNLAHTRRRKLPRLPFPIFIDSRAGLLFGDIGQLEPVRRAHDCIVLAETCEGCIRYDG